MGQAYEDVKTIRRGLRGSYIKFSKPNQQEVAGQAGVKIMNSVSSDHSLARNVFYTQSSRKLRPVSLDEILDMLVRYEGSGERSEVTLNEPDESAEMTAKPREVPLDSSLAGIYYTDF
jgi:hypothetical protein